MRYPVIITISLILLISGAAGLGNFNTVLVTVSERTSGTLTTGANVAQVAGLDANLLGNNILANQVAGLMIEDENIVGRSSDDTSTIQMADLMINDTGCANFDSQIAALAQFDNDLTAGNITQITVLNADDIGCDNSIDQSSSASIGNFFSFIEPNQLTNSDLRQISVLDVCVEGSANNAVQGADQFITDNALTDSRLNEQVDINANILGNENNMNSGGQGVFQIADSNLMTGSLASQLIYLDEQSSGNLNDVRQLGRPSFFNNFLTASAAQQIINLEVRTLGTDNMIDQNSDIIINGDNIVYGQIEQMSDIEINS